MPNQKPFRMYCTLRNTTYGLRLAHVPWRWKAKQAAYMAVQVLGYSYHHGYFDGAEREFRGFGRVEQWDTQELASLTTSGTLPLATNIDQASYVPPVLTRTWFHTGVFIDNSRISKLYEDEYDRESDPTKGIATLSNAQ